MIARSRLASTLAALVMASSVPSIARAAPTIVSVTFDDTLGDQYDQVRSLLVKHAVHATFYVNSGRVDGTNYMSRDQLLTLQADGNELGGHTVNHVPLLSLNRDEQRRQICIDRVNLLGLGFQVANFAYPLSQDDPGIQQMVLDCGYGSARGVGGLACSGCSTGESIPPAQPLHIRTPPSIIPTTTLADLKGYVTTAEAGGGGWVPLVFHHTCDGCNPLSVTPTTLDDFLTWLDARAPGTVVKTVGEVVGNEVKPGVVVPMVPAAPPRTNILANPSFELDADGAGIPDCWRAGKGTTGFQDVADAHDGSHAIRLEMKAMSDGPQRLISVQDMGQCAPTVELGQSFVLSGWVHGDVGARFVAYTRNSLGAWTYWTRSDPIPVSPSYFHAWWVMPPIPPDANGLSVGVLLESPGTMTIDQLDLVSGSPPSGCSVPASDSNAPDEVILPLFALFLMQRRQQISKKSRGGRYPTHVGVSE